eukprot:1067082-Rhodomonas_salina.1
MGIVKSPLDPLLVPAYLPPMRCPVLTGRMVLLSSAMVLGGARLRIQESLCSFYTNDDLSQRIRDLFEMLDADESNSLSCEELNYGWRPSPQTRNEKREA